MFERRRAEAYMEARHVGRSPDRSCRRVSASIWWLSAKGAEARAFGEYVSENLDTSLRGVQAENRTTTQRRLTAKEKGPRNVAVPEALSRVSQLRESHFRESLSRVRRRFGERISFARTEAKDMETHLPTTPFGRRSLTLAHVAAQVAASTRPPDKVVHKWKVFRTICVARPDARRVGAGACGAQRAPDFLPGDDARPGRALIVFPSNEQLSLRAHGMPASTLRRHLAALVDAGLIIRRDSPNGKRYARKGRGGEIRLGVRLRPLAARRPRRGVRGAWPPRSRPRRARSSSRGSGSRSAGATSPR